jgi:flagellar biosynthesis/type III secretory pathway chaperone
LHSQDLAKVVDILSLEVDLLRKLHSALEEEQRALVRGDVEAVKDGVEGQIGFITDLAGLEQERRAAFRALCPDEAPDSEIKLEAIIDLAGGTEAERLETMRSSMRGVLKSLGEVNRQNDVLIRQSLSYVDRTLRALAGENAGSEVYDASGGLKSATGQIAVDRKA